MNFVVAISFLSPRMLIAIKWESTIMYKQHHHFASLNFLTLIEGNSSSNCIYLPLIVYSLTRCQKLLEIASLSMGILEEITCMPFNQFRKEYGQFLFCSRIWVFLTRELRACARASYRYDVGNDIRSLARLVDSCKLFFRF